MRTLAITTLALAIGLTAPATAADRTGEFALGFNNTDAPVGLRMFLSPNMGFDVGVGFDSTDLGAENATSTFLEVGAWYVLYDYGDSFFFVRPALAWSSLDDRVYGDGMADAKWTVVEAELNLGAEMRIAKRFGLTFQHGLRYTSTSLPDEILDEGDEDSFSDFSTFGENVTEAGVWFTF